jgi:hypothetical protein
MSIHKVSPERLAELFHHYQQALAPDFGCIDDEPQTPWSNIPQAERSRLIAAARLALLDIASAEQEASGRYFAKPGEAEWGC